jgi:hypothetical protein
MIPDIAKQASPLAEGGGFAFYRYNIAQNTVLFK